MKQMLEKVGAKLAAGGAMLAAGTAGALAAVPAEVTTAITDAGADTKTVAGAVLVVMIGIAVFLWIRRAAK